MRRVALVQTNNRYGENVYLPYSVGLIWAYARLLPEVAATWELDGFVYLKESVERAADRLENPDLVAISCYIWNHRWSMVFAREVRRRWPRCLVLAGGVHVEDESPAFLLENPEVDLAIYGEGEGAFADLLTELAHDVPDLSSVGSLVWRDGDRVMVNRRREPVDVTTLRSPYLDGVFDPILGDGWKWQVAQESNRGCPYACTFCAWGRAALDKVRALPMQNVLAEIDWFAAHQASYIDNCDANFGILKRDAEIVEHLVQTKERTGYPERFRTSWAKNSGDKIYNMAVRLSSADMLKAVTLSMQSMDDRVLTIIKRKNIKYENLADLIRRYGEAGIPTYTELIMGLPGESRETYVEGIDRVLEAGQHDGLFCYPCLILPNTEMASPEYIAEHGLEVVEVQAMLTHGTPEPDTVTETQTYVVGSKTMTHAEWREVYYYSWAIQVYHVLGLTQQLACRLHTEHGVPYRQYYEALCAWMAAHPETVAGREYTRVVRLLDGVLTGGSWDLVDPRYGTISWPSEEYGYLQVIAEADRFYDELHAYHQTVAVDQATLRHLSEDQRHVLERPEPGAEEVYAREVVWYGRKGAGGRLRKKENAA